MAKRYELNLIPNYVREWTVENAVRELIQNAIDHKAEFGSEVEINYKSGVLKVGNSGAKLEPYTLLMGATTKDENHDTVGGFGEGYKVAVLVLLRLGKKVMIQNYGKRELWTPRMEYSKDYGSQVLVFNVEKVRRNLPHSDLVFIVDGITPEEYEKIQMSSLYFQDIGEYIQTTQGKILLDPKFVGKVYVNGLYVCDHAKYHYGYNFHPRYLKLGRDRKLASDFDLHWLASSMWESTDSELIYDLIENKAADVAFVKTLHDSRRTLKENPNKLADNLYDRFKEKHGPDAFPVSSQEELEEVQKVPGANPVIVDESHKELIKSSPKYQEVPALIEKSNKELMAEWIGKAEQYLPQELVEEFNELLENIKE